MGENVENSMSHTGEKREEGRIALKAFPPTLELDFQPPAAYGNSPMRCRKKTHTQYMRHKHMHIPLFPFFMPLGHRGKIHAVACIALNRKVCLYR